MPTMKTNLGGPRGYGENTFSSSFIDQTAPTTGNLDDGSIAIDVTPIFGPEGIDFFGVSYSNLYLNSNGLITFASPNTSYSPHGISSLCCPAIAPLWTDYDLTQGGEIYWDMSPENGSLTITWDALPPFDECVQGTNSFQLTLTARTEDGVPNGGFVMDVVYQNIDFFDGFDGTATLGVTNGSDTVIEPAASGHDSGILQLPTTDVNGYGPGLFHLGFKDGGAPTCYLPGTRILSCAGELPVEALRPGQHLWTKDHGWQPLLWRSAQTRYDVLCPSIRIRRGVFGTYADLKVSPDHRMLVQGSSTELLTGTPEVLASAKHLVNGESITFENHMTQVTYHHLVLPQHALIRANGCWSETLFVCKDAMSRLSARDKTMLEWMVDAGTLDMSNFRDLCRPEVKQHIGKLLSVSEDVSRCELWTNHRNRPPAPSPPQALHKRA